MGHSPTAMMWTLVVEAVASLASTFHATMTTNSPRYAPQYVMSMAGCKIYSAHVIFLYQQTHPVDVHGARLHGATTPPATHHFSSRASRKRKKRKRLKKHRDTRSRFFPRLVSYINSFIASLNFAPFIPVPVVPLLSRIRTLFRDP